MASRKYRLFRNRIPVCHEVHSMVLDRCDSSLFCKTDDEDPSSYLLNPTENSSTKKGVENDNTKSNA
jgi:hypothetical protein